MNNAVPALLALLVVCSLPAMTVVAAGPIGNSIDSTAAASGLDTSSQLTQQSSTQPDTVLLELEGTTNRLTVGTDTQRSYPTPAPEFGASMSVADDELRLDAHRHAFEQRFEQPGVDRGAVIDQYHGIVRDRIQMLNERERTAVQAHAAGEATDTEVMRAFERNYAEANELAAFVTQLEIAAGQVSGYSFRDDARETRNKLDVHRSELRTALDAAWHGERSLQVTLETVDVGYRLSAVVGDRYLQETQRFDQRNLGETDQIGSPNAWDDYVDELYPWALANFEGASINRLADLQLYRADIIHPQGDLDAFVDGATEQVTREHQELFVSALPREPTETWQDGDLEVRLNATPGHGPAEVTAVDVETGEPVEATITVDGVEVGDTGADGVQWIAPPGGSYELTVETTVDSVEVTVSN